MKENAWWKGENEPFANQLRSIRLVVNQYSLSVIRELCYLFCWNKEYECNPGNFP